MRENHNNKQVLRFSLILISAEQNPCSSTAQTDWWQGFWWMVIRWRRMEGTNPQNSIFKDSESKAADDFSGRRPWKKVHCFLLHHHCSQWVLLTGQTWEERVSEKDFPTSLAEAAPSFPHPTWQQDILQRKPWDLEHGLRNTAPENSLCNWVDFLSFF